MDDCKPPMGTYMKPFLVELNELFDSGVEWVHPKTLQKEISKVVAPCFCADAPVRAQIQQILCHGGRYCCHTCEKKMVKLPEEPLVLGEKEKRRRVFSFREEPSPLRTADRMELQTELSIEERKIRGKVVPIKGVKGKSIASTLPNCDRSTMVFPEYMHLLLGTVKHFF